MTDSYYGQPDPVSRDPKGRNRGLKALVVILTILLAVCAAAFYYVYDSQQSRIDMLTEKIRLDSLAAVDRENARLDAARRDSVERADFTSDDLAFLELHGRVARVVETTETEGAHSTLTYVFEDGNLDVRRTMCFCWDSSDREIAGQKEIRLPSSKLRRDADGRIAGICYLNGREATIGSDDVVWSGGRVVAEGPFAISYGSNGFRSRKSGTFDKDGSGPVTVTTLYHDYEYDSYGNWTKRGIRREQVIKSDDASKEDTRITTDGFQLRVIQYQ